VNACYDEAKRRPAWVPTGNVAPGDMPLGRDASGPVIARDQLDRALQRLSLEHRAILVLRYFLDQSPDEIGEALGIPRRTVYSRLQRALDNVRGVLEADARMPPNASARQEVTR
jgi:RNA polymerase sigma-70 factor (ECF subfamily)